MGLFDMMKPKAAVSYEIPYLLSAKEIARLEKRMFSRTPACLETAGLLGTAAPMLAKNEEAVDRFPAYRGKKAQKLRETLLQTYGGEAEQPENLLAQAEEILQSRDERREELYRITTENEQRLWSGLALRVSGIGSEQSDKLNDFAKLYDRMGVYGLPYPSSLSAYEMARAANLACICTGLGILSGEQALPLLKKVREEAAEAYAGWDEYLAGYLLGRVFWLYCGEKYLAIGSTSDLNLCRVLLNAQASPLARFPLREAGG